MPSAPESLDKCVHAPGKMCFRKQTEPIAGNGCTKLPVFAVFGEVAACYLFDCVTAFSDMQGLTGPWTAD